ncbi:hypothetical protein [Aquiflexum gelatinilyticum]|uniref:hypothetical protein n=1 Tax=Aquiflexum gelatinilyticum TaxID=2961943 RepID=UPI002168CB30|nr:hypothetical protein [Aquiflexum gelatinilyticum]MCS4432840.1 hypothetical protein [Aquiflexum gelatinilyticum]
MQSNEQPLIKIKLADFKDNVVEGVYIYSSKHCVIGFIEGDKSFKIFDQEYIFEQVLYWINDEENRIYIPSYLLAEIFDRIYTEKKFLSYWNSTYYTDFEFSLEEFIESLEVESLYISEILTPQEFWSHLKLVGCKGLISAAVEAAFMFKGRTLSISRLIAKEFIEKGKTPFFSFKPFNLSNPEDTPELKNASHFVTDLEEYPHVKESIINQLRELRYAKL